MNNLNSGGPTNATILNKEALKRERYELLQLLEVWLETPMLVLAFVWLALLVLELTSGESPLFEILGTGIWGVFILNFAVEFVLAPHKVAYLRSHWLTFISLFLPALRVFRVLRVLRLARAARGVRLLRVVSSLNRGMNALGANLRRRGFGYVLALTVSVTLAGAAGMYTFERGSPGGLGSYSEALWWTSMILTTMGSQFWPHTAEGRLLCVILALYAFAAFGYLTATLATFFVGRDADNDQTELAGAKQLAALQQEVTALRNDIRAMSRQTPEA